MEGGGHSQSPQLLPASEGHGPVSLWSPLHALIQHCTRSQQAPPWSGGGSTPQDQFPGKAARRAHRERGWGAEIEKELGRGCGERVEEEEEGGACQMKESIVWGLW